MTTFFLGLFCGSSIFGAMMILQYMEHRRELERARINTRNQVDNCLEVLDSIDEHTRQNRISRNATEPDWNAMVAPLFERGRK